MSAADYAAQYTAGLNGAAPPAAAASTPAAQYAGAYSQQYAQQAPQQQQYSATYGQQSQYYPPQQQQQQSQGDNYYAQSQAQSSYPPHAQQQSQYAGGYGTAAPSSFGYNYSNTTGAYAPSYSQPSASYAQQQQPASSYAQQQPYHSSYSYATAASGAPASAAPAASYPPHTASYPPSAASSTPNYSPHLAAAASSTAFRAAAARAAPYHSQQQQQPHHPPPPLTSSFVPSSSNELAATVPPSGVDAAAAAKPPSTRGPVDTSRSVFDSATPPPAPVAAAAPVPAVGGVQFSMGMGAANARKSRWSIADTTPVQLASQTAAPQPPRQPPAAYAAYAGTSSWQQATPSAAAPAAAPAAASAAAPSSASFWADHPGLLEYVERSIASCPAHLKFGVETYLRDLIASVQNGSKQPGTNWFVEPLAHMHVLGNQATQAAVAKAQAAAAAIAQRMGGGAGGGKMMASSHAKAAGGGHGKHHHHHHHGAGAGGGGGFTSSNNEPLGVRRSFPSGGESKDGEGAADAADEDPEYIPLNTGKMSKKRAAAAAAAAASAHHNHEGGGPKKKKGKHAHNNSQQTAKNASWVDPLEQAKSADRASRFREYNEQVAASEGDGFKNPIQRHTFMASASDDIDIDWSSLHIAGTCQRLEKRYLRLTQAPSPADVRPEPVLLRALDMVLTKWRSPPDPDHPALHHHDYVYTCEQLKSIRQDVTVQHLVATPLCIRVYEAHARIALEVGDTSEYNQCQTQLKNLYKDHVNLRENEVEFTAYRILYNVITNNQPALVAMMRDVQTQRETDHKAAVAAAVASNSDVPALAPLLCPSSSSTSSARVDDPLSLAFSVALAALGGDSFTFFRLSRLLPFQCVGILLRPFINKFRFDILSRMLKAYKPGKVSLEFLQKAMGFDDDSNNNNGASGSSDNSSGSSGSGRAECEAYLRARNISWTRGADGSDVVDAKTAELRQPETEGDADVKSAAAAHGVTHAIGF